MDKYEALHEMIKKYQHLLWQLSLTETIGKKSKRALEDAWLKQELYTKVQNDLQQILDSVENN